MKTKLKVLLGSICLTLAVILLFGINNTHKIGRYTSKIIKTKIGEEVTLKLRSNGSKWYHSGY
jgi:hypothetical protein